MVKDLLATAGAAQDADIFNYAATIEADQKAEIERMSDMLARITSQGSIPNSATRR
jgi:uncharacterized protein (DUF305 family)